MKDSLPSTCPSCSNSFTGKYCNQCGEKRFYEKDKKLSHLLEEVLHFITHFEGSFMRTFRVFLSTPGRYSQDYCNGVRKKYFKPVSFFLMLVILYLIFPRFQGLNMRFSSYLSEDYNYAWYAKPAAVHKATSHAVSYDEVAARYDNKSPGFAKISLLLLIPMSGLVLRLLFFRRKRYFYDHFILATELTGFYLFSHFLLMPVLDLFFEYSFPGVRYIFNDGSWLWLLFFLIFGIFTSIAFRRFYKQPWWLSIIKSIVFLFVFAQVIRYVYNIIVYYLVMLFI